MESEVPLPFLTAALPGVGGLIKGSPEDFIVEEIPAVVPKGHGEFLWAQIEKRGMTTRQAVRRIARRLRVGESSIRVAGMKDSRAVSRQWISVRARNTGFDRSRIESASLKVLHVTRHSTALRIGQLRGNRFHIVIRQLDSRMIPRLRETLEVLKRRGVPNYFGPQRFGSRGDNHDVVRALLCGCHEDAVDRIIGGGGRSGALQLPVVERSRALYAQGDYPGALAWMPRSFENERRVLRVLSRCGTAAEAVAALPRETKWLLISALQAWLFNRCLARRLDHFDRFLPGDLALDHATAMIFQVDDVASVAGRGERFEVSPTGPLFGPRMVSPSASPLAIEAAVLEEEGIDPNALGELFAGVSPTGSRRAFRCSIADLDLDIKDAHGSVARQDEAAAFSIPVTAELRFSLGRGSYATSVLREVMKTDGSASRH